MSPRFYRREAERTRHLAAEQVDHQAALELLRQAADFDDMADDLERPLPSQPWQAVGHTAP